MTEVSVVIPLYNKGLYIERALFSVLGQTFQDFEIIVVDDGSTDNGADVVRSFDDSRIRLIQQENAGVSVARNHGIDEAKAELIAFLDADDEWLPKFLETILRLRKRYPEAGAYSTAYRIYDKNNNIENLDYKLIPPAPWEGLVPNYFQSVTLGKLIMCSSAVAIPKEVFLDVGCFPIGVWWGEDVDMWGRIALKYSIAFSWEIGAIYHREVFNRACKKKIAIEEHCFARTAHKAINNGEVPNNILVDLNEYIARLEITAAIHNVFQGYNRQSLNILMQCDTNLFYQKKLLWIILSLMPPSVFRFISKVKRVLIK